MSYVEDCNRALCKSKLKSGTNEHLKQQCVGTRRNLKTSMTAAKGQMIKCLVKNASKKLNPK